MSSKESKRHINGGANKVELSSGDEGFYIDLTLQDLQKINENADLQRTLPHDKNGVRIFVTPTKRKQGYYNYYLTVAENV